VINVLYIHSHDTGRYIQPYGYPVPTPHLQKLAEDGILFRQAFCAAPTCSPSRAALLTGMAPHSNGMFGLAHFGFSLNDYHQHILHTLRKAGYYSALSGMQHIDNWENSGEPIGSRIGYDVLLTAEDERQGKHHTTVEQRAIEFLRSAPPQPFFLSVGFVETHRVFPEPAEDINPGYLRPPDPLPDTPETRRDMAGFITSARTLDEKMGQVLAALDETGLAENTLVVCTTDHGLAFPLMKCNLTDQGTGVMLIMRGPGGFKGGRVIDALVSQIDLFPTVCELVGVEKPGWLQGRSLLPLVRGELEEIHEAVFSEVTFHVSYEPMRAARTRRWKYIRRFEPRDGPVLPNTDDSPSKSLWMDHGWRTRPPASEQLYDLIFDPHEAHNLAGDPAHAQVRLEMEQRLHTWMVETGDPLLRGPVQWPKGFMRVHPDRTSPSEKETEYEPS
jgi:N-sulfoglucosamine sulfohydrolase